MKEKERKGWKNNEEGVQRMGNMEGGDRRKKEKENEKKIKENR